MNYYEQFYDDLETTEQDVNDEFDARNYRPKPYSRNEDRPGRGQRGRGGKGQNRGQGQGRGQGQNRGGGQHQQQFKPPQEVPKAKNIKPGFKMTNFVKAGELTPNNDQPVVTYPTQNQTGAESNQANNGQYAQQPGQQNYMSQSNTQQEANAFNYVNPLYGYGDGSDFSNYGSKQNQYEGQQNQYGGQQGQYGDQQGQYGSQQGQYGSQQGQYGGQQGQYGGEAMYPPGTQPTEESGTMPGYDSGYQYDSSGYWYGNQQWGYGSYWSEQQMDPAAADYNMANHGYQGEYSMSHQGPQGEYMTNPGDQHMPMEYDSNTMSKKAKKPTVIPSMHFVKSTTEFKSTDIDAEKGAADHPLFSSNPKPGVSRAGLGFGKSINVIQPGPKESLEIATQDAKFAKLVQAVKERNATNRNAIEVLHMATQKMKNMVLNFDIDSVVSTLANFQCIVTVNGIHIGKAADSKKKAAKNKASVEAVALLTCGKPLTVRRSSEGHYELKPKVVDVLQPAMNAESTPGKKVYAPSQGGVVTTKTKVLINPLTGKAETTTEQAEAYSKPKIVFHPASQASTSNQSTKVLAGFVKESPKANDSTSQSTASVTVEKAPSSVQSDVGTNKTAITASSTNPENSKSQSQPTVAAGNVSKPKIVFHSASVSSTSNPTSKAPVGFVKEGGKASKGDKQSSVKGYLGVTEKPASQAKNKKDIGDIYKFTLLKRAYIDITNKVFLSQSADFNGVPISYEFNKTDEGFDCSVLLGTVEVGEGSGPSKDAAKDDAVDDAVASLQDVCYTVVVKVAGGRDENAMNIVKKDLEEDCKDSALPETNIGNALLKKMGWVGGGIGKKGTGIAEPIKAGQMIGRQGLGFMGKSAKSFLDNVTKILTDYKNSESENELHFSPELTKEERAKIHQTAQRMKLRSASYGKGEGRYLTVSRKMNLDRLLSHVVESGGSTEKYEIIPPTNPDIRYNVTKRDAGGYSHNKQ